MKHTVFELFMKQALECVLDFCWNTLAVLHKSLFFFHPSFQIFETLLAFILKHPVLYSNECVLMKKIIQLNYKDTWIVIIIKKVSHYIPNGGHSSSLPAKRFGEVG